MGKALQSLHPAATAARLTTQAADLNINTLSYYTDAGDEFLNGADSHLIADVIKSGDVPYGLVQLDDWSHATNASHPVNCGCLQNWTDNPSWFGEGGWLGFAKTVGLPLALYLLWATYMFSKSNNIPLSLVLLMTDPLSGAGTCLLLGCVRGRAKPTSM